MVLTELTWTYTFFCGQLCIIYVPLLILDKLTQMSGWLFAIGWSSLASAGMVGMTHLYL